MCSGASAVGAIEKSELLEAIYKHFGIQRPADAPDQPKERPAQAVSREEEKQKESGGGGGGGGGSSAAERPAEYRCAGGDAVHFLPR